MNIKLIITSYNALAQSLSPKRVLPLSPVRSFLSLPKVLQTSGPSNPREPFLSKEELTWHRKENKACCRTDRRREERSAAVIRSQATSLELPAFPKLTETCRWDSAT